MRSCFQKSHKEKIKIRGDHKKCLNLQYLADFYWGYSMENFGKQISERRKKLGLSQEDLAEISGVSPRTNFYFRGTDKVFSPNRKQETCRHRSRWNTHSKTDLVAVLRELSRRSCQRACDYADGTCSFQDSYGVICSSLLQKWRPRLHHQISTISRVTAMHMQRIFLSAIPSKIPMSMT